MVRFSFRSLAAVALAASALSANAALTFDADVTNNVIYGSDNGNGGWTVDRQSGVELGLRAHVRFPAPQNVFNSNGLGTYTHAAGGGTPATRARWNFDWSINSDINDTTGNGRKLSALTYVMGIDFDPSAVAFFDTFSPTAGFSDNSFGDNTTLEGQGAEAADAAAYATLLLNSNLVQNSWNLDFFNEAFARAFDPTVNGTYSFFLAAFDGRTQVARTDITVVVGNGTVPEPASLALVGLALAGAGVASRRRRGA